MRLAQRIQTLPPYLFAEVDKKIAEKRASGADVISFGIGDPDLPTPAPVIDALAEAAHVGANHRYPDYYGLEATRNAFADWFERRFNQSLDPKSEVCSLIGSKEGIGHMAVALVDPGSVALCPDPGYPVFSIGTLLANGEPYFMPLRREKQFLPDLDAIPGSVLSKATVIWANYPNNPTAAVAPPEFLERLVAFAKKHDLALCHDMAYSEVTYDGYRPTSVLEIPGAREVAIEFHSLSKTYNMTGWRIGFAVGDARLVEALGRVKTNIDSGIFNAIQYAGIEALKLPQSWIDQRNAIYQRRRDVVVNGLRSLGLEVDLPKASLYVWAGIPEGQRSVDFSLRVLDEASVWVTPGNSFGPSGEGYVRLSITLADDRVDEAMRRLAKVRL